MQESLFSHFTLSYPHFVPFTQKKKQNLANKMVGSGPQKNMQAFPSDIHA